MKPVFADSVYFLAVLNRNDAHHPVAKAAAENLREPIVTTEWILAECADALAGAATRALVAAFIREMEQDSQIEIVQSGRELFQRGLRLFEERPDKEWSLTDCISFVVMRDVGIQEALTADRHFEQAGFRALLR